MLSLALSWVHLLLIVVYWHGVARLQGMCVCVCVYSFLFHIYFHRIQINLDICTFPLIPGQSRQDICSLDWWQSSAQLYSNWVLHYVAHAQKKQKQKTPLKPQTYCAITYAAADMAGARAAGVSSVSIHAWWWFGSCCAEVVMCLDPDPDPASHNVNLARYGCLGGYLPVVGPG